MDGIVAAGHGGATSPTTPGYRPKTSKRQGKYEIENYTLTMHFDDGAVQTTFLVDRVYKDSDFRDESKDSGIWVNGTLFVK